MKSTNKSGYTLPELMVGMIAAAVLTLTVGLILIHGWRGWKGSNEAVEMQRDASLALDVIAREIRRSEFDNMTFNTSGIRFEVGGVRSNLLTIYRDDAGALIHQQDGINVRLFDGGVREFSTSGNALNQSVTITLDYTSEDGYDYGEKTFTIYARNRS